MTTNEDTTALDAYLLARHATTTARHLVDAAKAVVQSTTKAEEEARYQAIIAVACPYCHAGAGERCQHDNGDFHRLVTHGVRDDLSGVNGEHSRGLLIEQEARRAAAR